jgi:hypothetical protein
MRILLLAFGFFSTHALLAQRNDSCKIPAVDSAYFPGIQNQDSITVSQLLKTGRLISKNKKFKVSSFTFCFDGDEREIYCQNVKSGIFSQEDIAVLRGMKKGDTIIFECILAKNKAGDLIRCWSLVFYITD